MRPTTNPPEPPTPFASVTEDVSASRAAPPAEPLPADHHLWRNGRLWWIAITLYDAKGRRNRVRQSLGTEDVAEARRGRDQYLDRVRREQRWTIAATALRSIGVAVGRARSAPAAPCRPRARPPAQGSVTSSADTSSS